MRNKSTVINIIKYVSSQVKAEVSKTMTLESEKVRVNVIENS